MCSSDLDDSKDQRDQQVGQDRRSRIRSVGDDVDSDGESSTDESGEPKGDGVNNESNQKSAHRAMLVSRNRRGVPDKAN